MKMRKLLTVLLGVFAFMVFGETYALITGIGYFEDKNIIPLPGAIEDARAFREALLSMSIVKDSNLLYYENPTLSNLKKALISWAKMTKSKDDLLIFYYSGHGYSKNGDTYLIPSDAYSDILAETALNFTEFLNKIKPQIKTKKVIIILDACYSGSLIKDRPVRFKTYEKGSLEDLSNDIVFLLSSKENEVSQERNKGGGWFTYYLIKGLMGKANTNGDDFITIEELYRYVSENVEKATSGMQHPVMFASNSMKNIPISWDFSMLEIKALKKLKEMGAPEDVLHATSKVVFQDTAKDNDLERKLRNYIHLFALGKISYDMYIDLVRALKISKKPETTPENFKQENSTQVPPAINKASEAKGSRRFITIGMDLGTFVILPFADVYLRIGNIELGIGGMILPSDESFFIPLIKAGVSMTLNGFPLKLGVYYGEYEEYNYDYSEYSYSETSPVLLIYTLLSFGNPSIFFGVSDLILPTFMWNIEY